MGPKKGSINTTGKGEEESYERKDRIKEGDNRQVWGCHSLILQPVWYGKIDFNFFEE